MHLVGASHSPDMWALYLWMQGGEIVKQKLAILRKAPTGFHPTTA